MIVGGMHDALFAGNVIDLHIPSGVEHTDDMQFYNSKVRQLGQPR